MKRVLITATMSLFALLSSSLASAAPTTYTLWCRGGGTSSVDFEINNNGGSWSQYEKFFFAHGTQAFNPHAPVTQSTLQPGQCSWIDRAMNPDEPSYIYFAGFNGTGFKLKPDGTGKFTLDTTASPFNVNGVLDWESGLQHSDCYWSFQVYNEGVYEGRNTNAEFIPTGATGGLCPELQ